MYNSGLPQNSTVSQVIKDSQWAFPITQTWELNEIRSKLPSLLPSNIVLEDHFKGSLTPTGQFTISSLWDNLRTHYPKVLLWSHVVWFPAHIPKCSIISWLAILNRLYTEDRLVLFGNKTSSHYSLCPGSESHDHLFFNCPFSSQFWALVTAKIIVNWSPRLVANWVTLLSSSKGKSLRSIIFKLAFTASISHIWIERNF